MKQIAVFALAMLVALFPAMAVAEEKTAPEEVWSATVLRVDPGSLLVRVEAVDPEHEERYPWEEADSPAPEATGTPEATEAPKAHSLAAEDASDDETSAVGIQLVRVAEDTPVWRRDAAAEGGFAEASAAEISEDSLLTLCVLGGEALGIIIEESSPDAGAQKS